MGGQIGEDKTQGLRFEPKETARQRKPPVQKAKMYASPGAGAIKMSSV